MFKALEVMTTENDVPELEHLLIESLENSLEVQQLANEISDLFSTAAELEHLHATISRDGITTSLMSFANRNNVLSNNIAGIPSFESFTTDISVEDSKVALESISAVLKTIYDKTIGKVAAIIKHFITSLKIKFRSIPAMRLRVDTYLKDISGKTFDEDRAKKITGRFVKYVQLLELIDHAKNANSLIVELMHMELPATEEEFVKFQAKLDAFKKKHGANYRFDNSNFQYDIRISASLFDKGYTAESFHVIADKIDEYVRSVISSEDSGMNEWFVYEDKVQKFLEDYSAKYTDDKGNTNTAYTKLGHMIVEATYGIMDIAFDIDKHSAQDGPIKALKTLNYLKQAYK